VSKKSKTNPGAESTRKHYARKRAEGWVRLGYWVPEALRAKIGDYVAKQIKAHEKSARLAA
jgi:predicted porin